MRSFFFLVVVFLLGAGRSSAADQLLLVIRVDDVLSRNTSYAYRSIVPFQDSVEAHGGKVTWAVIPARLTESTNATGSLSRELRATVMRGHEVAMHGFVHVCAKCGNSGHEMYCPAQSYHFPLADQRKLIDDGLTILRDSIGVTPTLFVPPGHYADSTTYAVLRDRKFGFASTTLPTRARIDGGLFNLAPHSEYTWQMTESVYQQNLHAALQNIRTTGVRDGYYCILLHDYFIRLGWSNGIVLKWMGEVLDSVKNEYTSNVTFVTLSEAANIFRQSAASRAPQDNRIAGTYVLEQNYPNPFNPVTTITYELPVQSRVVLSLCDVLGRTVSTLVNGVVNEGMHRAVWDASGYPSGVYFYRLEAAASGEPGECIYRATKRLVLMK